MIASITVPAAILASVALARAVERMAQPTTAPTASGSPDQPIDRGWSRTAIDEAPAFYSGTYALGRSRDGFVIIGEGGSGCCWSEVETWTSRDGRAWSAGTEPAAFTRPVGLEQPVSVTPSSVAGWRDALVVVGSECCVDGRPSARVWTSPDGIRWEALTPRDETFADAAMQTVVAAHDRIVVAGSDVLDDEGTLAAGTWASADGRTWSRTPRAAVPFGRCRQIALTATKTGFLAWSGVRSGCAEGGASLWQSGDGIAWDKIDTGSIFHDVFLDRVFLLRGRLIALGARDCRTHVFLSDDTLAWRELAGPAAVGEVATESTWPCRSAITGVAAGDAGVLAVGATYSQGATPQPLLWFSSDGERWHRVQAADAFASTPWGPVELGGVVAIPGGFLVAGGIPLEPSNKPNTVPAVWIWTAPPGAGTR